MSTVRTPMRLVPRPSRMPRRGSLLSVKKRSSAVASALTSRTSPPTTTPGSSGTRASCTSFAGGPPLLTTREAAIWEAPILRPTISCFRRRLRLALLGFATPGVLFFFGRRTRSDSLISLFKSTGLLYLLGEPKPALCWGLAAGGAAVADCRCGDVRHPRALEEALKLIGSGGARKRKLGRDDATQHQVRERLLHRLHAARGARLHDRIDLLDIRLPDQIANRVVGHQHLERSRAAELVGGRHEGLRDDALERRRELHAHLALLLGGEDVDDAVDRGRRALGVQRREHEVPGLGCGERGRDRLEVAHLADEDHVGVLAQRGAKPFGERRRVLADLALVDDARAVVVQELDRVLDGEDVLVPGAVDVVEKRGEGRRLA